MPAIIVKSEERRAQEAAVRRSFGVDADDVTKRDAVETITARTNEALADARREGEHRVW